MMFKHSISTVVICLCSALILKTVNTAPVGKAATTNTTGATTTIAYNGPKPGELKPKQNNITATQKQSAPISLESVPEIVKSDISSAQNKKEPEKKFINKSTENAQSYGHSTTISIVQNINKNKSIAASVDLSKQIQSKTITKVSVAPKKTTAKLDSANAPTEKSKADDVKHDDDQINKVIDKQVASVDEVTIKPEPTSKKGQISKSSAPPKPITGAITPTKAGNQDPSQGLDEQKNQKTEADPAVMQTGNGKNETPKKDDVKIVSSELPRTESAALPKDEPPVGPLPTVDNQHISENEQENELSPDQSAVVPVTTELVDNRYAIAENEPDNKPSPVHESATKIDATDQTDIKGSISGGKINGDEMTKQIGVKDHPYFPEQEDSHFFAYFVTAVVVFALGYLIVHNKQKILAIIVEGRTGRRRRAHVYRKLSNEKSGNIF